MKKLYIISWFIFAIGISLKLLHLPLAGILLLLTSLLLITHSVIFLIKNIKQNPVDIFLYFSISTITTYLIGRIQYQDWANPVFYIATIFTLTYFVLLFTSKKSFKTKQILILIYFVAFLLTSFVPSYKIYYAMNLNNVFYKETRLYGFKVWDKYSWFLYIRGKQNEALEANRNAKDALEKYKSKNALSSDKIHIYKTYINSHKIFIEQKNWQSYDWMVY